MTSKKTKNNLEKTTEKISEDNTLIDVVKKLFGSNTDYGIYHRNGWAFLALAFTTNYCLHPIVAFPILGMAGYNFIQAFRHKNELFEQDYKRFKQDHYEEFRRKYREERKERHKK